MDVIVYCAVDSGVDGREAPRVLYAAFSQVELNAMLARDLSRKHRAVEKKIINVRDTKQAAIKKLDGVDRLVLGLTRWWGFTS